MCLRYSSSVVAPTHAARPRKHRLEQVGGVDRTLGRAGTDDGVQLVQEQDDLPLGIGDLLEHGLESILEFAAVLGSGDQRSDVECDDALVAQAPGDVTRDDALRESFDDGGLADARLADQHRVVLRATRQHLDDAAHLVVAADDRVELAAAGGVGQVAAVLLECLILRLGFGVGHAMRATHGLERGHQRIRGNARGGQHIAGGRRLADQAQDQVLGRHILVAKPLGLTTRMVDDVTERRRRVLLARAPHHGQPIDRGIGCRPQRRHVRAGSFEQRLDDALGRLEQRNQQVRRLDDLLLAGLG